VRRLITYSVQKNRFDLHSIRVRPTSDLMWDSDLHCALVVRDRFLPFSGLDALTCCQFDPLHEEGVLSALSVRVQFWKTLQGVEGEAKTYRRRSNPTHM